MAYCSHVIWIGEPEGGGHYECGVGLIGQHECCIEGEEGYCGSLDAIED